MLVLVETISQFRMRYLIETNDNHPEWALDKEWLDLSKARHKVLNILELFDGIPVIDEDLDADYGPNDIDACLGLADLELRRVLRLIDGRLDNIAAIKQEEWREIGQAEMDAAR